jgi:hypothetical protein
MFPGYHLFLSNLAMIERTMEDSFLAIWTNLFAFVALPTPELTGSCLTTFVARLFAPLPACTAHKRAIWNQPKSTTARLLSLVILSTIGADEKTTSGIPLSDKLKRNCINISESGLLLEVLHPLPEGQARIVHKGSRVGICKLREYLVLSCPHLQAAVDEINTLYCRLGLFALRGFEEFAREKEAMPDSDKVV